MEYVACQPVRTSLKPRFILFGWWCFCLCVAFSGFGLHVPIQGSASGLLIRSYRVDPQSARFSLRGMKGPITITTAVKDEIKVKAESQTGQVKIADTQLDNFVQLSVADDRAGLVKFEVVVPPTCNLEIKCLDGAISIQDAMGSISAETTDGDITLKNLRCAQVNACSTSGRIFFDGEILPKGNYSFQSFNNLIDLTVPAAAPFQLDGTAFTADIDLGGFVVTNFAPGSKQISGVHRQGNARLYLMTHRGQIRFHKK